MPFSQSYAFMTQMSSVWLVIAFNVAYNAAENKRPSGSERRLVIGCARPARYVPKSTGRISRRRVEEPVREEQVVSSWSVHDSTHPSDPFFSHNKPHNHANTNANSNRDGLPPQSPERRLRLCGSGNRPRRRPVSQLLAPVESVEVNELCGVMCGYVVFGSATKRYHGAQ